MLIKIINGTYGHKEGNIVKQIKAGAPPIEVTEQQAQRLISLGVAKAVKPKQESITTKPANPTADDKTKHPLASLTNKELEKMLIDKGIEIPKNPKPNKAMLLSLLCDKSSEDESEEPEDTEENEIEDGEAPPEFSANTPV